MPNVDKSKLNGDQLFQFYTMVEKDMEYRSTLQTAYMQLGGDLFPLLEKCEREGKRIDIQEDEAYTGAIDAPFKIVLI